MQLGHYTDTCKPLCGHPWPFLLKHLYRRHFHIKRSVTRPIAMAHDDGQGQHGWLLDGCPTEAPPWLGTHFGSGPREGSPSYVGRWRCVQDYFILFANTPKMSAKLSWGGASNNQPCRRQSEAQERRLLGRWAPPSGNPSRRTAGLSNDLTQPGAESHRVV